MNFIARFNGRTGRPLGATIWLAFASFAGCAQHSSPTEGSAADALRTPVPSPPLALVGPSGDDAKTGSVTLITGDRVIVRSVSGKRTVDVQPGPERKNIAFHAHVVGNEITVLPSDVMSFVGSGKLDARLFNVSTLLNFGYDDEHRGDLPLIVTYPPALARSSSSSSAVGASLLRGRMVRAGATVAREHAFWPAARAEVTGAQVKTIWLDGLRKPLLDHSVPQIGAPIAWQAGYTGQGVTVAVLDSGIDATHPDLTSKVVEAQNFTDDPNAFDDVGHGTHVASTIAGSGAASGGKYKGVAPSARLLDAKVCSPNGCSESAILAGMQWAVVEKHARVVNMSLGGPDLPEIDPVEEAVNRLTAEHDALFVVAAGNEGPGQRTVDSPASAEAALAVGAVDGSDQLASFSSRGPRIGDDGVKPEITAPGVGIVAARSQHGQIGEPVGTAYVRLSGTSMATPHVAGAAAILASQHPDWSGAQIRSVLTGSTKWNPALSVFEQGNGRVDVAKAIAHDLLAEPTSLNLGIQRWPHDDDESVVRIVTYRNMGRSPITVDLGLHVTTADGRPAPNGMFAVRPTSLTVPAGGEAEATLTADTRGAAPDGVYDGSLIATEAEQGSLEVRTAIGITRELESYDMTFQCIGRDGTSGPECTTHLYGLDHEFTGCASNGGGGQCVSYDATGKARLRLPKGRYTLESLSTDTADGGPPNLNELVQPLLSVTGEATVVLDARLAKPIEMTVPRPTARVAMASVDSVRPIAGDVLLLDTTFIQGTSILRTAHLGPEVSKQEFMASVSSSWAEPNPSPPGDFYGAEFFDSPYIYRLSSPFYGRMPTGLTWNVRSSELATVHARYDAPSEGKWGVHSCAHGDDGPGGMSHGVAFNTCTFVGTLPSTRIEYSSTGAMTWSTTMEQYSSDGHVPITREITQVSDFTHYEAGQVYREHWSAAVFGPGFPDQSSRGWLVRQGDSLSCNIPFFSDSKAVHSGTARADTSRTTLFRDGQKVAETSSGSLQADVAPGPATFRVEREVVIGESVSPLSSKITAAWTFRSDTVRDGLQKLPVSAVRFAPELDAHGGALAGVPYFVPIYVQRQADSPAGDVNELTVDVSYDDGQTWRNAPLLPKGDGWLAALQHHDGASFVSLRAKSVDTRGNIVEETIVRAYGLKSIR